MKLTLKLAVLFFAAGLTASCAPGQNPLAAPQPQQPRYTPDLSQFSRPAPSAKSLRIERRASKAFVPENVVGALGGALTERLIGGGAFVAGGDLILSFSFDQFTYHESSADAFLAGKRRQSGATVIVNCTDSRGQPLLRLEVSGKFGQGDLQGGIQRIADLIAARVIEKMY